MAEPKITKIRRLSQERRRIVLASEKRLKRLLARLQRQLSAYITNELITSLKKNKDGRILKTGNNTKLSKINDRIRRRISATIDIQIRKLINEELKKIDNANKRYYKEFKPSQKLSKRANKKARRLNLSFKRHVVNTLSINQQITSLISANIRNEATEKEFKRSISQLIEGEGKLGLIQNHFWRTEGFEQFQVHARAVSDTYAKGLNLDYAIYAGGEIKTTREFCDERNGKVYTRAEILSWNNEDWQGKKKDNNILIDCGGYNCRHEFDWISKQLAVRLRPDLA